MAHLEMKTLEIIEHAQIEFFYFHNQGTTC